MEKNLNYPYNPFWNCVHFSPFPLGFVAQIWSQHSPRKLLVVSLVHSTLACSVSQYFDSEAEVWHICSKHLWCLECLIMLIEMTFVFSGFLSLTKRCSEFRFFQANYPNLCHCLQQTPSEAVLTTSLIFGSLTEMVSLQVLLNFLIRCSFFRLIIHCFPARS